jgi:Protein of unknown function (DUF3048) N-terminal domain/Protein of unknown function (DUF3048) C-terminal domain
MVNRDKILLAISAVLFLGSAALAYLMFCLEKNFTPAGPNSGASSTTAKTYIYFSRLTGRGVDEKSAEIPRVVAVMINNSFDSYPLIGLNDTSVVYEVPVEGVGTRFMALFAENDISEKVGPVRSARPYYLDWLSEYGDALYMHCGGSSDGLSEIRKQGIFDANEFSRTAYFWRDHERIAPHNLYTSSSKWQKYFSVYGPKREFPDWEGWNFGALNSTGTESVASFSVNYNRGFEVGWRYNPEKKYYERMLNGEIFADEKGNIITAENIVVQLTSVSVLDEVGRKKIQTIGSGEARVYRDGLLARATWKKGNSSARTRFYDKENVEITLAPGRTWVMIAPLQTTITASN